MKLLVCGGRLFGRDVSERLLLLDVLNEWHRRRPITAIIHGCARGADVLADLWAAQKRVEREHYPAAWDRDGKAAGMLRNAQMLTEGKPDAVLAFPGGRGTADMVRRALAAGVPVAQVVVSAAGWSVVRVEAAG